MTEYTIEEVEVMLQSVRYAASICAGLNQNPPVDYFVAELRAAHQRLMKIPKQLRRGNQELIDRIEQAIPKTISRAMQNAQSICDGLKEVPPKEYSLVELAQSFQSLSGIPDGLSQDRRGLMHCLEQAIRESSGK